MTEKQILKSIKALAAGECANYRGGFCAETDQRCHVINPNYDSIHDGAIDCDYFLECVLPANWELSDLVSYALWYDADDSEGDEEDSLPSHMRRCESCGQPFVFSSNCQKYCHNCAVSVRRCQNTDRKRKSRRIN